MINMDALSIYFSQKGFDTKEEFIKLLEDYQEHSQKASVLLDRALEKIKALEEITSSQETLINVQREYIETLETKLGVR